MDRRIHKYPFEINDEVKVSLPKGATILHFESSRDPNLVNLWAIVDAQEVLWEQRWFAVRGTGHHLDPQLTNYLATVTNPAHAFVWHIFER